MWPAAGPRSAHRQIARKGARVGKVDAGPKKSRSRGTTGGAVSSLLSFVEVYAAGEGALPVEVPTKVLIKSPVVGFEEPPQAETGGKTHPLRVPGSVLRCRESHRVRPEV